MNVIPEGIIDLRYTQSTWLFLDQYCESIPLC